MNKKNLPLAILAATLSFQVSFAQDAADSAALIEEEIIVQATRRGAAAGGPAEQDPAHRAR